MTSPLLASRFMGLGVACGEGDLRAALTAILSGEAGLPGQQPPPGGCLALSDGSTTVVEALGWRQVFASDGDMAAPAPMTRDTVHDLASVTKVVATTTALMILATAAEIGLDEPAARYLPAFAGGSKADVTLRDLLRHRAGLWEWWPTYLEPALSGASAADHRMALELVADLPLRYRPGSGRHYSDLSFMLLGGVIDAVTGTSVDRAVHALVLDRIGMGSTSYRASTGPAAASSTGDVIEREMCLSGDPYPVATHLRAEALRFERWRRAVLVHEVNDGNTHHTFGGAAGHAGLFSTPEDLLCFGRYLLGALAGSENAWCHPAVMREFWTDGPDAGQALGFRTWQTTTRNCTVRAYGHTGFTGMAFAVLPEHDATVVLATNRLHVRGLPTATDPMWQHALDAAHRRLHT